LLAAAALLGAAVWPGAGAWIGASAQPDTAGPRVVVLTVQDAISPATSRYIQEGIVHAADTGARLVVIELDTPGGLDSAMRDIIQAILSSTVPVATFVYPEGARAASAGTYILYASHVAAMAPATNLGAATPVAIGGGSPLPSPAPQPSSPADDTGDAAGQRDSSPASDDESDPAGTDAAGDRSGNESRDARTRDPVSEPAQPAPAPGSASERKAINDAVAYIRSLAERRGRNADWAERAVRSAESLSGTAAVAMNVVDLLADDLDDLLRQIDGRVINGDVLSVPAGTVQIERFEPDWRTRVLTAISDPTIAYILLLIGIYGLVFEGYSPGAIVPGVVGAISLLLAFFAFQILPVNYAGLALIVLGVILMLAEFLVPSFGALGIGGIAAFVFGSVILIDTDVPGFAIAVPLISSIALTAAAALLATVWLVMRSRGQPPVSGVEEMLTETARALEDFERAGAVWVHGERWHAVSSAPVSKGQAVRVTAIDGLTLRVEPANGT
jgi:membrane-bound serine protease (ClpP class)